VEENIEADASTLLNIAYRISPVLHEFLEQAGFSDSWKNLKKNNRENTQLRAAFKGWFDAFRTMRLIHELSEKSYPRIAPEMAVAPLLERAGQVSPDAVVEQLELLRSLQGV
jgi:hypothetical protein